MNHLFNKILTVMRSVEDNDMQGGWKKQYRVIDKIKGRISTASVSERTAASQEHAVVSHVVYCGPDEDIRRGDLVTDGRITVEIIAVRNPSEADHHLECPGVEVQNG